MGSVMRIIGQVTARIVSAADNDMRIYFTLVAVPDYRVACRNYIAVYRV